MTTSEAIIRLRQLDTMCPYLYATGNRVDRKPFADAIGLAITALEMQEGNLRMSDIPNGVHITNVGTIIMD